MGRDLHWTLDCLPPHLRAQAARKLGLEPPTDAPSQSPKVFAVPKSTPPEGPQKPRRRGAGLYKVNTLTATQNTPQTLPAPSPAGFKSIMEARAEKKVVKRRKTLTPDMAGSLVKSCKTSPDGNEVRFVLGCSPYMLPTAQEKKIAKIGNRSRLYKVPKVQKAEKTITLAMTPYAHLFKEWKNCPIGVWIDFCYEYPSGTPKKDLMDFRYSLQRSDLDNLFKGTGDALTHAGFWDDDNKIAELHLRKFRVLTDPRIVITIRKLQKVLVGTEMFSEQKDFFFKDIVDEKEGEK